MNRSCRHSCITPDPPTLPHAHTSAAPTGRKGAAGGGVLRGRHLGGTNAPRHVLSLSTRTVLLAVGSGAPCYVSLVHRPAHPRAGP
eukprot:363691-Chlamydomonas_euryale.AAC.2